MSGKIDVLAVIRKVSGYVYDDLLAAAEMIESLRPSREPAVVGNTDAPAGWEPDSSPAEVEEGRALTATLASLAATPAAPGGGDAAAICAIAKHSEHGLALAAMLRDEVVIGNFRAALVGLVQDVRRLAHPTPASTPQEAGRHRWRPDADVAGAVYCPKCSVTRRVRDGDDLPDTNGCTPQPAAGVDVVPVSVALDAVEHVGAANYASRVAEARRWIREAALAPQATEGGE